jgi:hypothetical protein
LSADFLNRSRNDILSLHIGKLLKTDKPAFTEYLPNGKLLKTDKPAFTEYLPKQKTDSKFKLQSTKGKHFSHPPG